MLRSLLIVATPYGLKFIFSILLPSMGTGRRRLKGSPKLQIIFNKRANKYRSLLREMTFKDKGSYESSPPCNRMEYCRVTVRTVCLVSFERWGAGVETQKNAISTRHVSGAITVSPRRGGYRVAKTHRIP